MKTTTFKTMAVFILTISLTTSVFAGTQNVNTSKSSVTWVGKKLTGQHTGTIALKEGNLVVDNGKITGGKVVIDMSTIVNLDQTDPAMNAKLVGHLKSDDFFGVVKYPTAELAVTKVVSNGNNHTFSGNLTIKGITNPVNFVATSSKDGKTTTYKGVLTVDRSKFNVRYGSKSFFNDLGDKVINDEFTLDFNIVVAE